MTPQISALHKPIDKVSRYLVRKHKMLIGEEWRDAVSGKTFDAYDPATGKVIASVPEGDAPDIDLAVKAARRSFDNRSWRGLPADKRAQIMWRYAELLEANGEELAHLDVMNNGMPLWLAKASMESGVACIRYAAGQTSNIFGKNLSDAISGGGRYVHAYTASEPVGVAGLIIPWNGPVASFLVKLAPALGAGCSCVVKPAENTPVAALRLAELALEAGVPAGVVNVVTGFGNTAGQALVEHEQVDKISFTGSTAVGKQIVRTAAATLKRVTLELGGKSPCIVFDDADLRVAIPGAAMGVFVNSGQMCIAGARIYAQSKCFDTVVAGLADIANSLQLGSGFDPSTQLGPVISAKQKSQILSLVEGGRKQGAEVVAGGKTLDSPGFFVQPTVLANVDANMELMRKEIFGPVLAVTRVDDLDSIIQQANNTRYGLAAGIFTNDLNKAHLVAQRLQAGTVWVNCYGAIHPSMPFGGYKESGWGREFGSEGIEAYLEKKSVLIQLAQDSQP
jgi:phenylacetaldehyde dehydrogenase